MHEIEPYYGWEEIYTSEEDPLSPFYGKERIREQFTHAIYDHLIHPRWDEIGSETLFIRVLYADYDKGYTIIEMMGEWNDTLYNDIMHFKRNIVDHFVLQGINKFILIGENVFNFHGSDDSYYEEWFEDLEDDHDSLGWIVAIGFQDFVLEEWEKYNIDSFINFGGALEINNWRTMTPLKLFEQVNKYIGMRLNT